MAVASERTPFSGMGGTRPDRHRPDYVTSAFTSKNVLVLFLCLPSRHFIGSIFNFSSYEVLRSTNPNFEVINFTCALSGCSFLITSKVVNF